MIYYYLNKESRRLSLGGVGSAFCGFALGLETGSLFESRTDFGFLFGVTARGSEGLLYLFVVNGRFGRGGSDRCSSFIGRRLYQRRRLRQTSWRP